MRYAYTLRKDLFQTRKLIDHIKQMFEQTRSNLERNIYKKDYIFPIDASCLVPELQEWLEQFSINFILKSYYLMDRTWHHPDNVWHYIEFDDDQTRMLFKLAWYKA